VGKDQAGAAHSTTHSDFKPLCPDAHRGQYLEVQPISMDHCLPLVVLPEVSLWKTVFSSEIQEDIA
jgi:hypothetical protein